MTRRTSYEPTQTQRHRPDVARRAGVSRAVVSRALSNNGSISPDARARVLRAAEELGYQVNFLARG
ncbi:LacI family transcriptional regulator [Klebsiella pneumoniae]|nr:LacI family transcriptional regulator [Klebsiella pneumoniae]